MVQIIVDAIHDFAGTGPTMTYGRSTPKSQSETAMSDQNKEGRPFLILFTGMPDEFLMKDGVASALQSFETSLYLVVAGRFPTVLSLIWEACEKLLRVNYLTAGKTRKEAQQIKAEALQQWFLETSDLVSKELHDNATRLRQARNEILHNGYSPKDDRMCIDLYFNAGVPYLDKVLKYLTNKSLEQISIQHYYSGGWFWEIYKGTRKVLTRRINQKQVDLLGAIGLLRVALRKIFVNLTPNQATSVVPLVESIVLHEMNDYDLSAEIEDRLRNHFIKRLGDVEGDTVELIGFGCPICGNESVLASVTWKGSEQEGFLPAGVEGFACTECKYLMVGEDLGKVFCLEQMSDVTIAALASDECPLAHPRRVYENGGI